MPVPHSTPCSIIVRKVKGNYTAEGYYKGNLCMFKHNSGLHYILTNKCNPAHNENVEFAKTHQLGV